MRKQVNACKINHNGNTRYRVCLPLDLQSVYGTTRKFFKERDEAETFCKQVNGSRQDWASRLLSLSDDDQGRLVRSLDSAGSAAEIELALAHWLTVRERTRKNIVDAIAEFMKEAEKKGNTTKHTDQIQMDLDRMVIGFESRNVGDITSVELQAWFSALPWAAKTIHNSWVRINSFFLWATARKYCKENPMASVDTPKIKAKPIKILTIPQIKTLLRAAHKVAPETLPYFAIGIFAGVRVAEMGKMTARHFVSEKGQPFLHLDKSITKTGQDRFVTVTPVLQSWLAICNDKLPVCSRTQFDKVRVAAGYGPRDWDANAMRHSFASYTAPTIGTMRAAKEAGHSEAIQIKHYRLLVSDGAAEEFTTLTAEKVLTPDTDNIVSMPAVG